MVASTDRPGFTLNVRAGFIDEWQWAVHAAVDYSADGSGRGIDEVRTEACGELLVAIVRECSRGRDLGARTVLVLIETDGELAGFLEGTDGDECVALPA